MRHPHRLAVLETKLKLELDSAAVSMRTLASMWVVRMLASMLEVVWMLAQM